MPKIVAQDIIIKKRKSLPKFYRKEKEIEREIEKEEEDDEVVIREKRGFNHFSHNTGNPRKRKYTIIFGSVALFIGIIIVLSVFFLGATVTIQPKQKIVSLNKTFNISKSASGAIHYDTIEISAKESAQVEATGTKEQNKKASGTIIVYNAYNAKPQKLIKNTRFESADGKIYRIQNSITVPGSKTVSGKVVPGSVETTVFADEPGDAYNISKTDFTLPGFKGDPRYSKFYARSKTNISGGAIGTTYVISEKDEKEVKDNLEKKLKESLLFQAHKNIPNGFILYDSATFFDFDELKITGKDGQKTVNVEEIGKVYAVLLPTDTFVKYVAQTSISDFNGASVSSPDIEKLNLTIKDKDFVDYRNVENFTVTLSGTSTIVWNFDKKALTKDLAGKPKKSFQSILTKYSGIDKAELSMTPFWAQKLPDNEENIKLKIVIKTSSN